MRNPMEALRDHLKKIEAETEEEKELRILNSGYDPHVGCKNWPECDYQGCGEWK